MRFPDWPERLAAYIAARETRRFEWGKGAQDCCSFAAGAVAAITGRDVMADIPPYSSAEEADVILTTPLEALLDARFARRDVGFAQRGDVALARIGKLESVVVVLGAELVGAGRPRGLVYLPRRVMRAAWAV